MYHRVAKLRSDPWDIAVTPRHFAEHLEVLRQHARPLSLQQLSHGLREGDLPHRSVVVTFDDGYADNLHNAKPLLERYDVPATFFLTSGFVGGEREFWWDELDRIFLRPGTLPTRLNLSVNGSMYRWELGEAVHYSEDASWRYRRWSAVGEEAPSPRHSLYRSIWELLHPLTEAEQRKVLDELLAWAGLEPECHPSHRPLSLDEVVALAKGGLFDVGGHTVTHPPLSKLSITSQRDEILKSKASLEKILGRPVSSFSYPHGSFSAETAGLVRQAGFGCSCANFPGLVERSTDPFQLPRAHVQDWSGNRFARQLSRWFGD